MKFTKEYVPDKRWQTGQRPVIVESSRLRWFLWKIVISLKNAIEKPFKIVEDKEPEETVQPKNE